MTYDVEAVRRHFPSLESGTAFFDGPGGSQVPQAVASAIADTMTSAISNRGRVTESERRADAVVLAARTAMADLLHGSPEGIVFGRSMTQLTFDVSRVLASQWGPGDEVVVSRLDHDANVRPWVIAAERAGAEVRWIDFDPTTGDLTPEDVAAVLSARTRLVALTGASNLIGTRPDLRAIADQVHAVDATFFVDAVHLVPHALVDVSEIGADVLVCSPYKFLGPHCGVLCADPALLETWHPDKLRPSADVVPERFELGTLPYEALAGVSAAVDFLAALAPDGAGDSRRSRLAASFAALEQHEDRLRSILEDGLLGLEPITLHCRAGQRTPTLFFSVDGLSPAQVHRFLAERAINAPGGSFYAYETSRRLGLGDAGAVRVGLAPYSDDSEIERLLDALADLLNAAR